MGKSTIGVFGLGVMGRNLALNLEEKGNRVSVYNHPMPGEEKVLSEFIQKEGENKSFFGAQSLSDFVRSLESPRKILLMVKADSPVDSVIEELTPLLENGDILIDGGNSHFKETERRSVSLSNINIHFVGMGVSGGEEGARFGPSMMTGTTEHVWNKIAPILESIAARAFDGSPCCSRIGTGGAGHFIKMIHNGIEYADMQLIAEAYHFMSKALGMSAFEISKQFSEWNQGPLNSYMFEITADILSVTDEDGSPLVEKILDSAGQKGTGKWTAISSLELGIPLPGITGAVQHRFISSLTDLREILSGRHTEPIENLKSDKEKSLLELKNALYASRIVCHAEGFYMITQISDEKSWDISPAEVARIWQGGCIIRSELLKMVVSAFKQMESPNHLLLADTFSQSLRENEQGWRSFISRAVHHKIPVPVISSSLSQYDSLHSGRLPANLIQAQRDYFGAHTYERIDQPRGEFFHTNWIDKC